MGCECWNSVTLYGSAAEIARFRDMCIDVPAGADPRNVRGGWDGQPVEIGFKGILRANHSSSVRRGQLIFASNYREDTPKSGSWSFAFDTDHEFPLEALEELASLFPSLHFACECIDSMDLCMGYGQVNVPNGGEMFRQDYAVPENYWTGVGGFKRPPVAHARHVALIWPAFHRTDFKRLQKPVRDARAANAF